MGYILSLLVVLTAGGLITFTALLPRWLAERREAAEKAANAPVRQPELWPLMATVTRSVSADRVEAVEPKEDPIVTQTWPTEDDEIYLARFPPARRQFYTSRGGGPAQVTAIVLHTAENRPDLMLPDGGADNVARFIQRRPDAGSYHTVVDSDSRVRLGRYNWTMFHCIGFNSRSLGLSWALRRTDWASLDKEKAEAYIWQGACEAFQMNLWVAATQGWEIPPLLLSRDEAMRGVRGFVDHSTMDPARRSDPDLPPELRKLFFKYYMEFRRNPPTIGETKMPSVTDQEALIEEFQRTLVHRWGVDIGKSGPDGDGVDRVMGPKTIRGGLALLDELGKRPSADEYRGLVEENSGLRARITEMDREIGRLRNGGVPLPPEDQAKIDYVNAVLTAKKMRDDLGL